MTDHPTLERRLRDAVEHLVATAPFESPDGPAPLRTAALGGRPARPRRARWAFVAVAALVLACVGAGAAAVATHHTSEHVRTAGTGRSTAPSPTAAPSTTTPAWQRPYLLPPKGATLLGATIVTQPDTNLASERTGVYAQGFVGSGATNPPRLLISTTPAPANALTGRSGTTFTVGGTTARLTTRGAYTQVLWQAPNGVVVSMESTGLTASTLETIASRAVPNTAPELGVRFTGPLPDGLQAVAPGYVHHGSNGLSMIGFSLGSTCNGYVHVDQVSASEGQALALVMTEEGGTVRRVQIDGTPAMEVVGPTGTHTVQVPGQAPQTVRDAADTDVVWWPTPGIRVWVETGEGCKSATQVAASLRHVDAATWRREVTALGAKLQISPAKVDNGAPAKPDPSAPRNFGLAH